MVTGNNTASLLFDESSRRIAYPQRHRVIDNRMTLKYDQSMSAVPVATYIVDEETAVRWLPDKGSELWLAELHKFEASRIPMELMSRVTR